MVARALAGLLASHVVPLIAHARRRLLVRSPPAARPKLVPQVARALAGLLASRVVHSSLMLAARACRRPLVQTMESKPKLVVPELEEIVSESDEIAAKYVDEKAKAR